MAEKHFKQVTREKPGTDHERPGQIVLFGSCGDRPWFFGQTTDHGFAALAVGLPRVGPLALVGLLARRQITRAA